MQQSCSSWLQLKGDPCHIARDIITLLPVPLLAPLSLPSPPLLSSFRFAFAPLPIKSPQLKSVPLGSERANAVPLGEFQVGSLGHICPVLEGAMGPQPGEMRHPLHSGTVSGLTQSPAPAGLGTEGLTHRAGSSDFTWKPSAGSLDKSKAVCLCSGTVNPLRLRSRACAATRNP